MRPAVTHSASQAPVRSRGQRIARFLFALADGPVVVAVAIGLAAAVLHPRLFWWAQLVAIGLPYAAWALVVLSLGAALLRWKGLLVTHAILLALVLIRVEPVARLASPMPEADDLRLTTFNLPQTGPSQEGLRDSATVFVRTTEPDLLLLQDTWVDPDSPDQANAVHVEAVVDRLPYVLAIPDEVEPRDVEGRDEDLIAVPLLIRAGSEVEVLSQESVIPEEAADVSLALRSHLRWQEREFVLYNLHLRSFGRTKPWEDPLVRWNQPSTWRRYARQYRRVYAQRADEADQIADRIAEETLPVIVAGDFNSTADNWSARRIQNAGAGRRDAFHVGTGLEWGRTYHAARPLVRIDYVFVDPAFEVTSARVMDVGFSDHRPVLTQLRWASDG